MIGEMLFRRCALAFSACCLVLAVAAQADTTPKSGAPSAVKAEAAKDQMEAMMKLGQPGTQHEMMKKCEGSWKAVVKTWMGPGDPVISDGTAEFKMILDGRFLEQRFTGTMMDKPYEGYGLTGYDNMKKAYTAFWVDNGNTGMMNATGSYDESKKALTFKATSPGPDGKPMTMRMVNAMPDDNTQVFTMYSVEKGKEMKMMEITYTRATP